MDQSVLESENAARLCTAIHEALAAPPESPVKFFASFEDAVEVFGDELHFEANPCHFTRNLPFWYGPPKARQRVCSFFTGSGSWAQIGFDFRSEAIFQEVGQVAAQGGWSRQMRAHRRFRIRMREGRPMRRNNVALDTVSKIDAYFKSTAELLASIADKGVVKRPAFTVDMALSYTPTEIRPLAGEMLERDVGVGIGPQGELLRVCSGLHRTAAALHLGVTSMPVELRMIHIDILRQNGAADDPLAAIRRTLDYARSAFAPENQSGVAPHRNQQPSIHQETPSS